jgi:cytochrome P450
MVKARVAIAHPKEKKVLMNLRIPLKMLPSCNKYAERHAWETEMGAELNFDMWSPEYQDDLYQTYKILRDDFPVYDYQRDGNDVSKCWILSRYNDVQGVFRDKLSFKNSETRNDLISQLQSVDGEKHKGLRSAVFPKLMSSAIAHIEPDIDAIVTQLLNAADTRGNCDLVEDIAHQIPRQVVPVLLGFPEQLTERMVKLVDPLAGYDPRNPVFPEPTLGDALINLVDELIAYKQNNSGDDLMSELLALEDSGELEFGGTGLIARCFAFAAFDTTINLLANGTVLMADNPAQRQKLIDDPDLMPQTIAEMLRLESPTQMIPRRVRLDVDLHHQKLSVGDEVLLLIGAANRDERHFENADCFDISRNAQEQIAFGSGIHTCIGRHLAKLEATVYFRQLLSRFPNYQVGARRYKASGWSRSFAEAHFSCA